MSYSVYRLKLREIFFYSLIFTAADALIAYTFYDSFYAFLILFLVLPFFLKKVSRMLCKKRIYELRYQFCEMIGFIASYIAAGVSVENSVKGCVDEMKKMFGDDALISNELMEMKKKLELNVSVIHCFYEFSNRAGIEDINSFTAVFTEAIKSGGNLNTIISGTVSLIQDKQRIEEEIESMLKGKMLEQKIMMIMPFMIIIYLRITSVDFINILYHNMAGIIVMTIALMVFVFAYIISEKIIDIRL